MRPCGRRLLACAALFSEDLSKGAKDAKGVMTFGAGSTIAAGGFVSDELGTAYGPNGEFGCYVTGCFGSLTDASVSNFASFGLYKSWNSFPGQSVVVSEGASIPFIEVGGFTTGQVLDVRGNLIGSVNSLSIGVGVVPIQVGGVTCHTYVVDAKDGLATLKTYKDEADANARRGGTGKAAEPKPPIAGGSIPAPPTVGRCFWLDPMNQWQPMSRLGSKEACRVMDSCSGGGGVSGGGCYKWAASATAPAEPWAAAAVATRESCESAVQGKIAWDYRGSKGWEPGNIARLCGGQASLEPARCFERVMHGGINWGGGTRWQWSNAIDLCGGTSNASTTITCFQSQLAQGWEKAIAACRR